MTASTFWKKEKRLKKLNSLGIIWLNYQSFKMNKETLYLTKANELRGHVRQHLIQTNLFHHLKKNIGLLDSEINSLSAVILRSINSRIILLAQLLVFSEYLEKEKEGNILLWTTNDSILRTILE